MRSAMLTIITVLVLTFAMPAFAQRGPGAGPRGGEREPGELSLTVYSTADPAAFDPQRFIAEQQLGYSPNFAYQVPGFGVVKDTRSIRFGEGTGTVRLTDVAAFIDPTTVSFTDLENPEATTVLEQRFLFDLVSPEKLLENYIDREVTVRLSLGDGRVETVTGRLLSINQGQLVIQVRGGGIRIINRDDAQVQLGELPGGLITEPTLQWLVSSGAAGERRVRTTYQTDGLTWRADYNLVLNEDDTQADLSAWVTLMNLSGASYPNTQLKLIAGDVRRIEPDHTRPMTVYGNRARSALMAAEAAGFEEKAFYEYHLYTLPRRTDVVQNSTQQIALFPPIHDIDVEKVMVYYGLPMGPQWSFGPQPRTDRDLGLPMNTKVDVYIRFKNTEENRMGIPLPAGKVRVYKRDVEGDSLEFVGEDLIDHTPTDETVLIKTGQAFDVVGERVRTDYQINTGEKWITESFRIELRNHKTEPVEVIVKENLFRWVNWEITEQSDEFEKVDARTIHFNVTVPPDGEKVVEYTVRYTW